MERRVGDRYRVGREIGSGSFGKIHIGVDVYTNEQVAIKFESAQEECPYLYFESKMYSYLKGRYNGIPKVKWFGRVGHQYALVMDLLGSSLERLLRYCGGKLSLKTVLMLAFQMLNIVEYLHSKSFVHRDIKPDNFTMGLGAQANQVFMIDFGLAKKYRDTATHEHIPYSLNEYLIGTPAFASINAHDCIELTRRDDLESLGYLFMYFLRGRLPWQGLTGGSSTYKFRSIRNKKVATSIEELCQGFPLEFETYLRYCHTLRFDEAPNYAFLKRLFQDLFSRKGFRYDYVFDWTIISYQQNRLSSAPKPALKNRQRKSSIVPYGKQPNGSHFRHKDSVAGYSRKHSQVPVGKHTHSNHSMHKNSAARYSQHQINDTLQTPKSAGQGGRLRSSAVAYTKHREHKCRP